MPSTITPTRRSVSVVAVSLMTAATLFGADSVAAANVRHVRHATAGPHYSHYYGAYRARTAYGATLPYGPEYGFLRNVPPNAVRGPGYTFVPGVGILGESCDLPSSACTNEYRDVH
jgi:hypothetical protein